MLSFTLRNFTMAKSHDEPCLASAGLKRSSSLSLATEFCHKLPYSGRLVPFTARAYLSPEPCDRSLRAASLPVEAYGSEESRHCKRAKTVPVSPTSPRYHADKFGKENQVDSFLFRCADFIACDILGDQDCPAFSKTRHELVDMAMENMSVDSYHPHPDCLTLSYSADLQHEMKNQSVEVQIVARNMLQIALKHVHENWSRFYFICFTVTMGKFDRRLWLFFDREDNEISC